MGRPKKNSSVPVHAAKKVAALEGTFDILTETDLLWEAISKRLSRLSRVYGFSKVELPFVEDLRLYENFYRGDAASLKKLVTLDIEGKTAALRPAALPSVLRAYYQHKVFDQAPVSKWAYSGTVVRQNSQGKLASDWEFGFEVFGGFTHLTEAQVIGAVWDLLLALGLKDAVLEINHLGKSECQAPYQDALRSFLSGKKYDLCDSCSESLKGRALDVFRCNNLGCQAVLAESPTILDFLDQDSRKHFTSILEALDELRIPYQLNHLYAGPSGHGRTNFVIKYKHKGETVVIGEGGYHEELMQNLCGKNYCCFGFAGNLGKVFKLLESSKVVIEREVKNDVFLVPLGELAAKKSLRLFRDLTAEKISVYDHFGQAGVKNQLKQAQAYNAPIALIMGQKEAMDEMVILRDVKSGMQEILSYDKIVEEVKKRLGK